MKTLGLSVLSLLAVSPLAAEEPSARSEQIAAMEKIADLALVPPTLNTSPLPEYDCDKLDYGMTIGIERTPGGRLWACWVAGGDSPKAFFVLATSDDDGETWSKPRLVVDAHDKDLPAQRSVLVGNLWTAPLPTAFRRRTEPSTSPTIETARPTARSFWRDSPRKTSSPASSSAGYRS